jgi:ribosomal protein S21|tara:strand:+ start:492 stop:752 length:261 start_codon:yes stop_codon:yes gene_type:complete
MINGRPALVAVFLRKGESQQSLLRRFLKICKKENILEEIFKKGNTRRYNKKSVKEKMKRKEAERRRRAEEIKSQKRNNRKSKYAKH